MTKIAEMSLPDVHKLMLYRQSSFVTISQVLGSSLMGHLGREGSLSASLSGDTAGLRGLCYRGLRGLILCLHGYRDSHELALSLFRCVVG